MPRLFDDAFGVYQKSRPLHAHIFAAIERLFAPYAPVLRRLEFGIGAQRDLQFVLLAELGMGFQTVLGNTDQRYPKLVEFLQGVGKADRFLGAAGGAVS